MLQMLTIAHQNSLRRAAVDDLLDMDKLVAGKMTLQLHGHSLVRQMQLATDANQGYAAKHGVYLQLEPLPTLQLIADDDRLQQVLANLISNAVKFSPEGGTVSLGAQQRGAWVRIWVRDQGPGIAPSSTHGFSRSFPRPIPRTRARRAGRDWAWRSAELIEHMHGRIGFDSEPGHGAFWCELPLAPAATDQP